MSVLESFEEWKEYLASRVHQAQRLGMSNEKIADVAYELGDYLADKVDPKNGEERLLKELWDISSPEEQHMMANLMIKLVDKKH